MDSDAATDRAPHGPADPHWQLIGAVAATLAMMALAACGSSAASSTQSAKVRRETCKQLEAALSDGPEPASDPIGYAQAQVLPLRQIHTADPKLRQAIATLASAYRAFSSSNGSAQAKGAVTAASRAIKVSCPGIES